jgi:Tol biopolymer transport system component
MKTNRAVVPMILAAFLLAASCGGGGAGSDGGGSPVHPSARIDVTTAGGQAEGSTRTYMAPASSSTGRYVAFVSSASNLVAGDDNNATDLFLRDTQNGTTIRIAEDVREFPSISMSADGRYTVFAYQNSLLGIYDRVADDLTNPGLTVASASLSADGRYLAFFTQQGIAPDDHNGDYDVYVYDTVVEGNPVRVSETTAGAGGNNDSDFCAISGDGSSVAFRSDASDLVLGDSNGVPDVFLHRIGSGQTTRVSVRTGGAQMEGAGSNNAPAISSDGSKIVFNFEGTLTSTPGLWLRNTATSQTTALAADGLNPSISANGRYVVYQDGIIGPGEHSNIWITDTQILSTRKLTWSTTGGAANGDSNTPVISGDGAWIVFESAASNLMEGDTNGTPDFFRVANPFLQ